MASHSRDSPSLLPTKIAAPSLPRRQRRWWGSVVALLILAALVALSWYLVRRANTPEAAPAAAGGARPGPGVAGPAGGGRGGGGGRALVTVGEAIARQASIPVLLDALGTVTSVATITVRPQVSGVLTEVLFTEGQMVRKGQVLARIDPQSYQAALLQAQGTLQRDQAQLDTARITLERFRTLLQQDSIARQEVDTQASLVRQLEGTILTDRAAEKTAQLNLGYTQVVAPAAGRLGLRTVDAGNYLSAGDATGLAVITQIAPIDVQFSVPQDRVPDIQARTAAGARLTVTALDRNRATTLDTGVFSTLDNLVDIQTGTIKAKARFANTSGTLFPNQFVNLQLLLQTIENAVVVPVTALRTGTSGDYVYVINNDRTVSLRPVKRGQSTVTEIAIASGLQVGEKVVTEGGDRLKDGAAVQLAADRPVRPASSASAPAGGRRQRATP